MWCFIYNTSLKVYAVIFINESVLKKPKYCVLLTNNNLWACIANRLYCFTNIVQSKLWFI